MAGLHDPKKLTETVELDYFRRPRWLRRGKRTLGLLVFAVSLAAVGFTLLPRHRAVYEAGPLSVGHAMFNNDCGVCHTQAFRSLERFIRSDPTHHAVSDQTCRQCHVAGEHHGAVSGCAACHREHRGHAILAQVADRQCTACHSRLQTRKPGSQFRDILGFSSHPDFALWRDGQADPGTVLFDHAKHLSQPTRNGLQGIDAPLSSLKQQQCGFCHQADPAGRYMKPISYDAHCKACHPLQVQVSGAWRDPDVLAAAKAFAAHPLPHPALNQGPALVRAVLRQRFLDFAQGHLAVLEAGANAETTNPPRPLPGRRGRPATDTQLGFVERQVQMAETWLFDGADGCRRCHVEIGAPVVRPDGLPNDGKPEIPRRWFRRSKFRHQAHRMLDCRQCHPQAPASKSTKDLLLPRIDLCRECHGVPGGARADCFECHSFHARAGLQWSGSKTVREVRP